MVLRFADAVCRTRRLRSAAFARGTAATAAGAFIAIAIVVGQRRRWHDAVAHSSGRREHIVVGEHPAPRPRHQRYAFGQAAVFELQ